MLNRAGAVRRRQQRAARVNNGNRRPSNGRPNKPTGNSDSASPVTPPLEPLGVKHSRGTSNHKTASLALALSESKAVFGVKGQKDFLFSAAGIEGDGLQPAPSGAFGEDQAFGHLESVPSATWRSGDYSMNDPDDMLLTVRECHWLDAMVRFGGVDYNKALKYVAMFSEHDIPAPSKDADCFLTADLLEDVGITDLGDRCRILTCCRGLLDMPDEDPERLPLFQTAIQGVVPYQADASVVTEHRYQPPDDGYVWIDLVGKDVDDAPNPFLRRPQPPNEDGAKLSVNTSFGSGVLYPEELRGGVEWKRKMLSILELVNEVDAVHSISHSMSAGPGERILLPLMNTVLPLPQFVRDPIVPSCCSFVLRVCTLDAAVDDDTVKSLTNRWTFFIDVTKKRVVTIHRVDSVALATLRAHCELQDWTPMDEYPFVDFIARMVELFVVEYEKAVALAETWLDDCEAHILDAAYEGRRTSAKRAKSRKARLAEDIRRRKEELAKAQNDVKPLPQRKKRQANGTIDDDVTTSIVINSLDNAHDELADNAVEQQRKPTDSLELSTKLANQHTFLEGVSTADAELDPKGLLFRLFRLQRRANVYERMIQLSQQVIVNEVAPQVGISPVYVKNELIPRFTKLNETVVGLRHRSQTLLALHISITSYHTTDLMNLLTKTSMVFVPMTFLAGVWGMNFEHGMAELRYTYGYPLAWAAMLVFAVFMSVFLTLTGRIKKLFAQGTSQRQLMATVKPYRKDSIEGALSSSRTSSKGSS